MNRRQWYLSTIDAEAARYAKDLGIGLEIAEFCTASNISSREIHTQVRDKIKEIPRILLHGPFNELFPCAIDPKARELAAYRYRQALELGQEYGAEKVILHAGFQPSIYYPCWFTEQSILFWKTFLQEMQQDCEIVLENVMETDPKWLLEIVRAVDDPRLRLCLDVGHANAYSGLPVEQWIDTLAPYLSHFHLHNNQGKADTHDPLFQGSIPMEQILQQIDSMCPNATCTIEVINGRENLDFLSTIE